jgi:hypothetical protein
MNNSIVNWFRFASPYSFYPVAGKMMPWFWLLAAVFGAAGLWIRFFLAPTDATQGEGYRIIFVTCRHGCRCSSTVMATWAGIGLALNAPRHDGGPGAHRRADGVLHLDRRLLGQADVGHLVGWDARLTSN